MTGVVLQFPGVPHVPDASAPRHVDDGVALLKAINALLDQAIASGVEPDWDTYRALCGMAGRLAVHQSNPASNPPRTSSPDATGEFDLELLWRRALPAEGAASMQEVLTYRLLLRDMFLDAARRLEGSEDVRAADIEHLALFLRCLQAHRGMVLVEGPNGGAH